ncbi:MAG: GNAT family N-acetyltransferase [Pseudomonadota bacterium]
MKPGLDPIEERLRDGGRVLIRPVCPEDKSALRAGLGQLSVQSRYRRFMAPIKDFTEEQLRYLTEVDYTSHMAWVAWDPDQRTSGLGIARYVRIADEPEVAEAAVTVVDSHHSRGLGTLLLRYLSRSARQNGIHVFRGYVLEENAPMLRILSELGAQMEPEGNGVLRIETRIPDDDKLSLGSPAQVLKAVALQRLPPLAVRFLHDELSLVVKLFSRRRSTPDDQD